MPDKFIRLSDEEAVEMLEKLVQDDMRKDGAEVAWLIRQETIRRMTVSAETLPSPTIEARE